MVIVKAGDSENQIQVEIACVPMLKLLLEFLNGTLAIIKKLGREGEYMYPYIIVYYINISN